MKTSAVVLLAIFLGGAAVLLAGVSDQGPKMSGPASYQTSAAYRDGWYLAQVDAESGRKPHIFSGRWTSDVDRAAYITGYRQHYFELAGSQPAYDGMITAAFNDGVRDGSARRRSAQPFHADKYASRGADSRQAYANGYQQGYYTEAGRMQSTLIQNRAAQL